MADRTHGTVGEHDHVVGEAAELIGVVADPDHRDPRVGEHPAQVLDGGSCRPIERGGRLVREQHRGFGQERPSDAHPLRLAARQALGVLAEQLRVEPDVLEDVAGSLGVDVRPGDPQVVEHGAREQRRTLEHHRHLPAQFGRRPLGERPASPTDLAGDRIVEPVQQPQQRRFARP